jgi:hypothetical protein
MSSEQKKLTTQSSSLTALEKGSEMAKKKAARQTSKPKADEPDETKGRPAGSENRQYDHADASPARCRKCGSTERTRYEQTRQIVQDGTTSAGLPFTHVVWRRTCCKACGQWRIDQFFENRRADVDAA